MDNDFDQTTLTALERPLIDDLNQGFSQVYRTLKDLLLQVATPALHDGTGTVGTVPTAGFIGAAGLVTPAGGFNLAMAAGLGFYNAPGDELNPVLTTSPPSSGVAAPANVSDLSAWKPLVIQPPTPAFVVPASNVNPRRDLIEINYQRLWTNSQVRELLNTITGKYVPGSVKKTLQFLLDSGVFTINGAGAINYKTGTPAAGAITSIAPAPPAVDAGYQEVARIIVPGGAVALDATNVEDMRQLILLPHGQGRVSGQLGMTVGGVLSLTNVMAPPGVRVCAVKQIQDASHWIVKVYVIAGAISFGSPALSARATSQKGTTATAGVGVYNDSLGTHVIAGGELTGSVPATAEALGQETIVAEYVLIANGADNLFYPGALNFAIDWSY